MDRLSSNIGVFLLNVLHLSLTPSLHLLQATRGRCSYTELHYSTQLGYGSQSVAARHRQFESERTYSLLILKHVRLSSLKHVNTVTFLSNVVFCRKTLLLKMQNVSEHDSSSGLKMGVSFSPYFFLFSRRTKLQSNAFMEYTLSEFSLILCSCHSRPPLLPLSSTVAW